MSENKNHTEHNNPQDKNKTDLSGLRDAIEKRFDRASKQWDSYREEAFNEVKPFIIDELRKRKT